MSDPIKNPPSRFEVFLWFCAGADRDILERCPGSDRVKYQGIGGIIFATGVLAFVSSSYAFWTVFSPKDLHLHPMRSLPLQLWLVRYLLDWFGAW